MTLLILDQTGHSQSVIDMTSTEAITEAEAIIHAHQQKGSAVFADGELLDKGAKLSHTTRETLITCALQGG